MEAQISQRINFKKFQFHPVIKLPHAFEVYDFSKGYDPDRTRKSEYGIGKYNEKRPGMYLADFYGGVRNIHMGIDISAPVGTEIYAFFDGEVFLFGNNSAEGDYGYTLITRQIFEGVELYALHGHLSAGSLENKKVGQKFEKGEVIARVGDKTENGGWNPHLHFQLSYKKPLIPDLPGAVSEKDLDEALKIYPDPRLVLGKLY